MKEISLLRLSLAIYIDMFLRLVTTFINTYMISRVDVSLVGALGAGNEIFLLFVTVFGFLAVGCSVLVAQARAKNPMSTRTIVAPVGTSMDHER